MTALMWGDYARAHPDYVRMVSHWRDGPGWSVLPETHGESLAVATDLWGRDVLDFAIRAIPSPTQLLIDEYLFCRSHSPVTAPFFRCEEEGAPDDGVEQWEDGVGALAEDGSQGVERVRAALLVERGLPAKASSVALQPHVRQFEV